VGGIGGTGTLSVASGGHLAPGLTTGSTIGTLTALGPLTINSGGQLDMGLGAPGTSDTLDMPATYGNFALTTPAGVSTVGVNFSDPAGGAAGNGTYTLMTFQAGQYAGHSSAGQFFTSSLPSPNSLNGATIAYHLADSSNVIQDGNPSAATKVIATVSGGPNALVWTGAINGNWNTATANFNNAATNTSTSFAGNDNVTFDDTGANTNPIAVDAGGVQPNIVTINNSSTTYSFSGGDIKGSSLGGGGGLYLGGTGAVTIDSKYTSVGPITSNKTGAGAATFNGSITAATSLTVNGGAITLSGANTYTGNNVVNGGSLTASGAAATFGNGNVTVNAGSAAIAAGVTNAILNSATLTLLGGGTANTADVGFISLAAGINEQVGSLVLGTSPQLPGTYGATGSGAINILDEYFSGGGIITVVAPGLPGDFNSDGKVDAGDYVTWRKNNGTNNALANDGGLGTPIGPSHFNLWRANFGNPPGAGSGLDGAAGVPEPSGVSLTIVALGMALVCCGRKRQIRAA
jgi:autotransporter-associated beta strand protein